MSVKFLFRIIAIVGFVFFAASASFATTITPQEVINAWYGLAIDLVRHTPTYTPPVGSRTYAYMGVTAYESVASGSDKLQSLAGQLNGLKPLPKRETGKTYDDAVVLNSALSAFTQNFFPNTGPTGLHAMAKFKEAFTAKVSTGVPPDVIKRSASYGKAIAAAILNWSKSDGGANVKNMGFSEDYKMKVGPEFWVPTNTISMQQRPLLPHWGNNRTFAIPKITDCTLKEPVPFSEEKGSAFYKEAYEVYHAGLSLTPDQRALANFWSDDAMLTPTPAGHGVTIALQVLQRDNADLEKTVDVLARIGVTQADAMIGAWHGKYIYDRVRPITYIQRNIDPKWAPLLITPPFPDYPSGHSVQSGTLGVVLTKALGDNIAFEDMTGVLDGLPPRHFKSFWEAGNEAAISRLYGGIHYRHAIENGLAYGKCIGEYTNALKTRR